MDVTPSTLISNPYVAGRPLTGASSSLYTGREDVFGWFEENLSGSRPSNALLLYGERRIGKTSTLYQLVEGQRGSAVRENAGRSIFPAYIDLQRLAGRPTDEWLRRLARDICQKVNTSSLDRSTPDSGPAEETAYAAFDRCIDRLENTLPADGFILLAVDEFEQLRDGIESGILDPNVLPFLRSQIQHRERLAFLLCGSGSLLDPFWHPIVDLAARYELKGLGYEETVMLVRQPVMDMLTIDDDAVEAIWERTSGHPFLIQTICHRLVSLSNRRHSHEPIVRADADNVIRQLDGETRVAGGVNGHPSQLTQPNEGDAI